MSGKREPVALTIAGSDPSGGAGIQADLKTFTALGVYGASVITALTAQNTTGVSGIFGVTPQFIDQQLDAVASDLKIAAVKTGMLGDTATVETVARGLQRHQLNNVIVDPVMVATSGDLLLAADAVDAVRSKLIPLATLITPNLHEAAVLTAAAPAKSLDAMEAQARVLLTMGPKAVLIKGGHFEGTDAVDVLLTSDGITHLSAPRIATRNTHGTGCTLSAAIAANMVKGLPLVSAVQHAKQYLTAALAAAKDNELGSGPGPVDHMHGLKVR